jgi:hypothetical protein
MVDSAVAVADQRGFHHCPPNRCLGERLVEIGVGVNKKRISPDALIFSIKKQTA